LEASKQTVRGHMYKIMGIFKTPENPSVRCTFKIIEQGWIENGRLVNAKCDNEKKFHFKQANRQLKRQKRQIAGGISQIENPNGNL
jgi:hypothetical protein